MTDRKRSKRDGGLQDPPPSSVMQIASFGKWLSGGRFFTIALAVFCALVGLVNPIYQEHNLPYPYFQQEQKRISGNAILWRGRFGQSVVIVSQQNGIDIFLDCFPVQQICDQYSTYSTKQRIGDVEVLGYSIGKRAYWPGSVEIDGKQILTQKASREAYERYREQSVSFFNFGTKTSLFLALFSLVLYSIHRRTNFRQTGR